MNKLKLIDGLHQVHEGALMPHLWRKCKVEKPSNTWELNGWRTNHPKWLVVSLKGNFSQYLVKSSINFVLWDNLNE
jgi:hypothetical protein